jgi:hypothetical protein
VAIDIVLLNDLERTRVHEVFCGFLPDSLSWSVSIRWNRSKRVRLPICGWTNLRIVVEFLGYRTRDAATHDVEV